MRVAAKKLAVVKLHKMLANIQHQQMDFKLCLVAVYARDISVPREIGLQTEVTGE